LDSKTKCVRDDGLEPFYGGSRSDEACAVIPLADGSFCIVSDAGTGSNASEYSWIFRIDSNGIIQTNHQRYRLSNTYNYQNRSAFFNPADSTILVAAYHSSSSDAKSIYIAKESIKFPLPVIQNRLVLKAEPSVAGTVTGSGLYNPNTRVRIRAVPNPDFRFVAWMNTNGTVYSTLSEGDTYSYPRTSVDTLIALFSQRTDLVTVTLSPSGAGIKTVSGGGIYSVGQAVTIKMNLDSGYRSLGWQVYQSQNNGYTTVSTDNEYTFTIEKDTILYANTYPSSDIYSVRLELDVYPPNTGVVTGAGIYPGYVSSDNPTVTATAKQGWIFDHWRTGQDRQYTCDPEFAFKPQNNTPRMFKLTANFVRPQVCIAVFNNPKDSGFVTGAGSYGYGTAVKLRALPHENQVFEGWYEGGKQLSRDTVLTVIANEDHNIFAYFAPKWVNLTLVASPTEGGTVTGGGVFNNQGVFVNQSTITIQAKANSGWRLLNWTNKAGETIAQGEGQKIVLRYHDTLTANFARIVNDPVVTIGGRNTYGSNGIDGASDIKRMPDGGYLVAGYVNENTGDVAGLRSSFSHDGWLVRLNADKSIRWQKCLGGSDADFINGLALTADGGCIAAGSSSSSDGQLSGNLGGADAWLIKLDSLGNMEWSKNYGTAESESFNNVIQLPDGSFAAVGYYPAFRGTSLLVRVSATGTLIWQQRFSSIIENILLTNDSNIVVAGYQGVIGPYVIFKFTPQGENILATGFGEMNTNNVSITATTDGNLVLVSNRSSIVNGDGAALSEFNNDGYMLKLSSTGEKIWSRFIGARFIERVRNVVSTPDGGVIAVGTRSDTENDANFNNVWAVKVSATGVIEWEKTLGGTKDDVGIALCLDQNGQPTILAKTNSNDGDVAPLRHPNDMWVVSLNATTSSFTVSATTDEPTLGTITGAGVYNLYTTATLKAQNTEGSRFERWSENGTIVSISPIYAFTVIGNRTLKAHFSTKTLEVITLKNNLEVGTVTGKGYYTPNTIVTVLATPIRNWSFVNWTEHGIPVSDTPSYSFNITKNRLLQANFERKSHDLTLTVSPPNSGQVIGSGAFSVDSMVSIKAKSLFGWQFVNWTENGTTVSSDSTTTIKLDRTRAIQANFQRIIGTTPSEFALRLSATSDGTVTGGGVYTQATSLTAIATPSVNCRFLGWVEGADTVSKNQRYTFILSNNRDLEAIFQDTSLRYELALLPDTVPSGTTTGRGIYLPNTQVVVTATPSINWRFVAWIEGTDTVSRNVTYSFIISRNRRLKAVFVQILYTVQVAANVTTAGTASGSGIFARSASVTVIATPSVNWRFVAWVEGIDTVSRTANYTFSIFKNWELKAIFKQITNELRLTTNTTVGGTATGAGTYLQSALARATATPSVNWRFVAWLDGVDTVSKNAVYSFVISRNRDLVAVFVPSRNPPPANDNCQNADTLLQTAFINGTTIGATLSTHPNLALLCEPNPTITDVWYKFRCDTGAQRALLARVSFDNTQSSTLSLKYAFYKDNCSNLERISSCKTVVPLELKRDTFYLLDAGQDYYVRVWTDSLLPANFKIGWRSLLTFNQTPIANATTLNSCQPFAKVEVNSSNSRNWISLIDSTSGIVAEINPNGNSLGLTTGGYFINSSGTIRRASGTPYLDRNIGIKVTNQPATDVGIRLYFTEQERAAYFAAVGANPIAVTHYAGALCLGNVQSGSGDLLPAVIRSTTNGNYYVEFNTRRFSGFFIGPNNGLVFSKEVNGERDKLRIEAAYPMPVSTELAVIFTAQQRTENGKLFITDILGKVVLEKALTIETRQNELQLDVSTLSNGLYFLNISDGVRQAVKKIVKQ
jgi:hypothetical protein